MKIIGLIGKKRSGKNTSAQIARQLLVEMEQVKYPHSVIEMALAEPLKILVREDSHYDWGAIERKDEGVRELLQWFGTEVGREIDKDLWIKIFKARIKLIERERPEVKWVFVTDVRFENELDAIHDLGGSVWRIYRETGLTDGHASETEMDQIPVEKYDFIIDNFGTPQDLSFGIRKALMHELNR